MAFLEWARLGAGGLSSVGDESVRRLLRNRLPMDSAPLCLGALTVEAGIDLAECTTGRAEGNADSRSAKDRLRRILAR